MTNISNILQKGFVTKEDIVCQRCKKTEKEMQEDGKAFLVFVRGLLVCGGCALQMMTPIFCKSCNSKNNAENKFCSECGTRIGEINGNV